MKKAKIKKLLLAKRDDVLQSVKRKKYRDLSETEAGDEIDTASQSVEKEILFELSNNEKVMLDSIESALRKIERKKYGLCESCQKPIPARRLKAMPWARYCIACQKNLEK